MWAQFWALNKLVAAIVYTLSLYRMEVDDIIELDSLMDGCDVARVLLLLSHYKADLHHYCIIIEMKRNRGA